MKTHVIFEGEPYILDEYGKVYNTATQRYLDGWIDDRGYLQYHLVGETAFAHRLVALAWISNPEGCKRVRHLDGNKLNNHISNLEWTSISSKPAPIRTVDAYTKTGIFVKRYFSSADLRQDGLSYKRVTACLKGELKSHGGLTFKEVIENN